MLEGLSELGGGGGAGSATGGFDPSVAVTGAPSRNASSLAYTTTQQPSYSQETPLQKLATFGAPTPDFNHMDPNAQSMYAQGYGTDRPMGPPPGTAYQHQRQMVRPPTGAAASQYPYQTDNMYSMPDVQVSGMGDTTNMQAAAAAAGWGQHAAAAAAAGYPSMHRYTQMSQYRQQPITAYPHQQEPKQQFPTGQHPMMQQPHQATYQMQQRHTSHYPQASSGYPTSASSQSYAGYMTEYRTPQYPQTIRWT
ncbi:hypothetical protein JTB14_004678 [Gonioctena quinquepunctata]|nr:hypothetical protein JTB14_004678 [Gonioctena quinquepunctata]